MKLVCVIHCGVRNEEGEEEKGRAMLSSLSPPQRRRSLRRSVPPFFLLPPSGRRRLKRGVRHQKCNRGDVGESLRRHLPRPVLAKNRIGLRGFRGNQIRTVAILSLEVPNPNFQPILMMSNFFSI